MYEIQYNPLACNGMSQARMVPMVRRVAVAPAPTSPTTRTRRPIFGKPKARRPAVRERRPVAVRPPARPAMAPISPVPKRTKAAAIMTKRVEPAPNGKEKLGPKIIEGIKGIIGGGPIATVETTIAKKDMNKIYIAVGILSAALLGTGIIIATRRR